MCVSSFNFVGLSEKSDKKFNVLEFERKKIVEKKRNKQTPAAWFKYTWYINLLSMCGPSFNFVCLSVPEKRAMKFFDIWKLERKKNEEIKGRISRRNLVLFHMKQQMIHNTCIKLQNPMCNNSSWEIIVTNFPMYYIGVRDGKKGKRRQNKSQQFCFLSHNILGHSQCVYKIWRLWLS